MRDILKPMSTCNSVETWCKRAEYRVCRWRSPWLRLKSTESDHFVSLISVTKCCVTITTGLHVSVSFEDKNASVGGKGKEVHVSGSRDSRPPPPHPSESSKLLGINKKALQSKFTLLSFNNTKIQSVNGSKEHYSKLKSNFINIHVQKLTYPSLIYQHWTFTEHRDH